MILHDFLVLIHQMKKGSVPKRLIFIWQGTKNDLLKHLNGIETHCHNPALEIPYNRVEDGNHRIILEEFIKKTCEQYEDNRNEPSALIIENAILFPRYGCDLSFFLHRGISPRSAVILVFPPESRRQLSARTDALVNRNTNAIVLQVAKQIGEPNCIIET